VRTHTLIIIALCLVSASASAQDGLYGSTAPEDAALVRVINASAGSPDWKVDIGPVSFDSISALTGTAYRPVQPGIYLIPSGAGREVLSPARERFYTVIGAGGQVAIFEEERHTDPARSQLILYNMTSRSLDVFADEQNVTLMERVGPRESQTIVINALALVLAAADSDNGQPLDDVTIELVRGASYGLVAIDATTEVRLFVVEAAVASE
jgi:hypothetical protein